MAGQVKAIFRYNLCVPTSWTQDTNWTYIRHSEHIKDVFWTSFVRSIYVLCLMDRLRFNFMSLLNISRETSATNLHHQETDKIVEIKLLKEIIKLATLVALKNYGPSFEITLSGTCNLNWSFSITLLLLNHESKI